MRCLAYPQDHVWWCVGGRMGKETVIYGRLHAKYPIIDALTQQFEELQQLRDRVRRAEAIAIWAWRNRRSSGRGRSRGCGSIRRHRRRPQ
jgi:hypothetical protein